MNEFLTFFDEKKNQYPMHLEVFCSGIVDWFIRVYKEDMIIVEVQHCDVQLCFAKAHVTLKEWLLEHESGY